MEQKQQDKWESLATVKAFDLGASRDHNSLGPQSNQQLDVINFATTTPISLLVQSLVQQLCTLLEKDPIRASQLYSTICQKLHSMNLIDDSYSMGEFEVMRSQYQKALYQLVAVASGTDIPITLPLPASWPIVQPSGLEWSRYHKEFEELYFIAKGGFGSVFKAKHRLDGVEYAIKKIYIRSSNINSVMNHLAEVKTLASLNHTNIVNYKAAWLEPMIESNSNSPLFKMDTDTDENDEFTDLNVSISRSVYSNIIHSFKTHSSKELVHHDSQSDFSITFENSDGFIQEDESSDEFADTDLEEVLSPSTSSRKLCKMLNSKEYENCSRVNLKWATLFIQMTHCHQTLKQWLDERNKHLALYRKNSCDLSLQHSDSTESAPESPDTVVHQYQLTWTHMDVLIDMFTQLVQGLHYIHSKGIIHHDIKPSNIFVANFENSVQVQLGDFGLSCPLQRSHNGLAVGTQLYAAPEQLDGQCNPKSDMYSLGIILLEMVETFGTDMERVKNITDLRKGQIPAQLTANHPKVAHIIGKLVQRRPSKRLDTTQLLDELKRLAENKDETIKSLREELEATKDENRKLKLMIASFEKSKLV